MKIFSILLALTICLACNEAGKKQKSIELITEASRQTNIFNNLIAVTNNTIPEARRSDSLAFLILPVQASCPACRKKTIDSIIEHRGDLPDRRFVVISANGGRKTIGAYFKEENSELPIIENKLFLDSMNRAFKYDLYSDKPTIYYTFNQKAYKKISSIPITVKQDLHSFFTN
ncbi:hypothetical protein A3860_07650 [Niastella vici]|uniref:Alkyl hydroperoxide reductase subunit C/ Thiol specific antioxidant domain-containing protein n=1 Tax=Niastella vici TaxID=1703345 RepID=A0A1V9FIM6_9BACT|nr:hypothetical protein [Niastella vici]OQP58190.1 hypothetical protein A3860_07650 [Niastella vici]